MPNKPKGRPKTDHSRPLIFQRARSRVVREIPLSGKTAATLDRYVEWAALHAGADKEETLTLTVEKALKEAEKAVGAPIAVKAFVRYELGEGIKADKGDFAAEVAAAAGKH